MYYVINVSLHGRFYFATSDDGITNSIDALALYSDICYRFLQSDGFEVRLIEYVRRGTELACTE